MSEFANTIHPTTPPMTVADCTNVRKIAGETGDPPEFDKKTRSKGVGQP